MNEGGENGPSSFERLSEAIETWCFLQDAPPAVDAIAHSFNITSARVIEVIALHPYLRIVPGHPHARVAYESDDR